MKLTSEHKTYIVARLAMYESPAEVADSFRELYGEKIESRRVHEWDASMPANRKRIAKDLRELFDRTRKEFDEEKISVPIASKLFQLRMLQKIADRAFRDGNDVVVMDAIERAAKITGGAYTNHRTLSGGPGKNDAPVKVSLLVEVPPVANSAEAWIRDHTPQGAIETAAGVTLPSVLAAVMTEGG